MKLSNTSETNILLSESKDYKRLSITLYFLTALALLYSGLHWLVSIFFCSLLAYQLRIIFFEAKPHADIQSIILKKESWLLESKSQGNLEYEKASMLIDVDFFQLIAFRTLNQKSKLMVVFADQMQPESLYNLRRRLAA